MPDAGAGAASGCRLPSGLQKIMDSQRLCPRVLLPAPEGARFDFRLFRALLVNLERERLDFPTLDADQSGKRMLTALSQALQYVLPFDGAEPSPLRLAGRVHLRAAEAILNAGVPLPILAVTCGGRNATLTALFARARVAGAQQRDVVRGSSLREEDGRAPLGCKIARARQKSSRDISIAQPGRRRRSGSRSWLMCRRWPME